MTNTHDNKLDWMTTTTCMIHSDEANQYLEQALQIASNRKRNNDNKHKTTTDSLYIAMNKKKRLEQKKVKPISEEEKDDSDESISNSSSLEYSSGDEDVPTVLSNKMEQNDKANDIKDTINGMSQLSLIQPNKNTKKIQKQSGPSHEMIRQLGSPPLLHLPLQIPPLHDHNHGQRVQSVQSVQSTQTSEITDYIPVIQIPIAILSTKWKDDSEYQDFHKHPSVSQCKEYMSVSNDIRKYAKPIVVLLLRSGRFAGAVFQKEKCLVHRVCSKHVCFCCCNQ